MEKEEILGATCPTGQHGLKELSKGPATAVSQIQSGMGEGSDTSHFK